MDNTLKRVTFPKKNYIFRLIKALGEFCAILYSPDDALTERNVSRVFNFFRYSLVLVEELSWLFKYF